LAEENANVLLEDRLRQGWLDHTERFRGDGEEVHREREVGREEGRRTKTQATPDLEKYLKGVAGDKSLTQPLFIEAMKKQVNKDKNIKETLGGPLPIFFHAVDANGDGMIQEDEFSLFFQILGLDPKMAPDSFKAIDTNKDGQLSLEEFVQAGTEFFTSENEKCPSKHFWGPLVN